MEMSKDKGTGDLRPNPRVDCLGCFAFGRRLSISSAQLINYLNPYLTGNPGSRYRWTRMMTKVDILERVLFVTFVVATNALVAINLGWVFLTTSWISVFLGVVPLLGSLTLVSFLAFVFLEDYLGSRRYGSDGFHY
jgi:hypothetical protein